MSEAQKDDAPTKTDAVCQARAQLGREATPRMVRRYLKVMHPGMTFTEKSLATVIARQRKLVSANHDPRVSQLTDLSALLAAAGVSPGEALAQVRRVGEWALGVGGVGPLTECLELLAGFQRPAGSGSGH